MPHFFGANMANSGHGGLPHRTGTCRILNMPVPCCTAVSVRRLESLFIALLAMGFWLVGSVKASELAKTPEFLIKNWDQEDGLPSTRIDSVARSYKSYW
jgi:hypothetical protein